MEEAAKVLIKYDLVEPTGPDVADSVDPRIEELLKRNFQSINFDKEKEVASRLTELSLKREKTFDPRPAPLVQDDYSNEYSTARSLNEPVIVKGFPVGSNMSPSVTLVYAVPEEEASTDATAASTSAASSSQIQKLDKMMAETKQSREICSGYLEMMNWDYDAAIALFNDCNK